MKYFRGYRFTVDKLAEKTKHYIAFKEGAEIKVKDVLTSE